MDGRAPTSAAATAAKRRQVLGVTVDRLLDEFLARYARPNLRSADQIARSFADVRSRLGSRSIYDVTRRDIVARMSWQEIDGDTWVIPAERYKTGEANAVPLTKAARELLGEPKKSGFIFTSDDEHPISGFSKAKRALDAAIAELRKAEKREPMPDWRLHDLRRTGRSLMSRAGVPADHGERVLGHVIGGVRGTYDLWTYVPQKKAALEKLAALVRKILNPKTANVVELRQAR
jgi:integrase